MQYPLTFPFPFRGQTFTEINLSKCVKPKHKLAYARVAKLARDRGIPDSDRGIDLESLSEDLMLTFMEFEIEARFILMGAFCEDFPQEALTEISEIDCENISRHITRIMDEHNKLSGHSPTGRPSGKKPIPRKKSAS